MIIKELKINHFGKFHQKDITLNPGVNIIYGGNEAGKSTIHHFIHAMLFGVERLRGKGAANDEYTRYFPWENGQAYEGMMVIEHEGNSWRLYRDFHKDHQVFRVFNHQTGEEVHLATGRIDELIPGLNEANFKNTVSIAQRESRIDDKFAVSLQSYLANMSMTKDEAIDISQATAWLTAENSRIQKQTISMPKHPLADGKETTSDDLQQQIEDVKKQMNELTMQEQQLDKQVAAGRHRISELRQQEQKERMEGVRLLEKRRMLMQSLKAEEDAAEAGGKKIHLLTQRSFLLFIGLTVLAVLFMLVQLIFTIDKFSFKVITGCLLAAAIAALGKTSFKKPVDEIDVQQYKQQLGSIQKKLEPYQRKYGVRLTEPTQTESLQKQLEEWTAQKSTVSSQREKLEWTLEELEKLEIRQVQYEDSCKEISEKNKKLRIELEAIALAKMVIQDLAGEIQKQFGGRMNERVAEIFSQISGQESGKIMVDNKLNIHIDGMTQNIPLNRLSMGAVDQMYFALRFCAADLIFENQEMPLLIDDGFAYYDDERMERLLGWLVEQDKSQIILFTCHHREEKILERLGVPYHYVMLAPQN